MEPRWEVGVPTSSSKTGTGFKVETLAPDHMPDLVASWEPFAYKDVRDLSGDSQGTLSLGGLQEQGNTPFFCCNNEGVFSTSGKVDKTTFRVGHELKGK